jgi:hypothetical protein
MDFEYFCLTNRENKPVKIVEMEVPSGNSQVDYSLNITSMVSVSKLNNLSVWLEVNGEKYNIGDVNFNLEKNVNNNLIIDPLPKKEDQLPENIILIDNNKINLNTLFPWDKEYFINLKKNQDDALEEMRKLKEEQEKNKVVDNSITLKSCHQHLYINKYLCNFNIPKQLSLWACCDTVEGYIGLSKSYVDNSTNQISDGCFIKICHF